MPDGTPHPPAGPPCEASVVSEEVTAKLRNADGVTGVVSGAIVGLLVLLVSAARHGVVSAV
jgi:hypothetical protein